MSKKLDLRNKVFNKLTVLEEDTVRGGNGRDVKWICKCECGNIVSIVGTRMKNNITKSCGCLLTSRKRSKHPLYSVHAGMKRRCISKKETSYPNYGGRGITVCDRWLESFENFYEDMKDGYKEGLQLDRIDNDGNYEPSNCRWVTHSQNQMNKRVRKGVSSKYKGVSLIKARDKWVANIGLKGKVIRLGYYDCEKEAALVYNEKAKELFGEYANLNKL